MQFLPPRHSLGPRRRLRLDAQLGALLSLFVLAPAFPACSAGSTSTTLSSGSNGTGGSGGVGATATTGSGGTGGELLTTSSVSTGGAGGGSICPPDEDGDAIPDEVEGKGEKLDSDGDGKPDYQDLDSDGDSMPDSLEGQTKFLGCNSPQDTDSDGKPDFQDKDSDNNGLPDRNEIYPDGSKYDAQKAAPNPADTDGDGIPDYADPDNDNDALPDTVELAGDAAVDTDGDGVPDLDDLDSDDDGIADTFEGLADPDGDSVPAFRDLDSDGDGLPDKCEAGANHQLGDPPADHDNDGKYDSLDLDSDNDGIPDAVEDANQNCTLDPGETDPYDADTDADGASDLVEVLLGSDPRNTIQTPGSLGKYYFVMPYFDTPSPVTNLVPLKTNLNQGDVAFVVDTTATMGGEIQNLKSGLSGIIQALYSSIPDLAVGIAGHDDFPTGTYGAQAVDQPFYVAGAKGYVSTVLLDNLGAVQALNVHDGGDFPESQVAAYHRALTDQFLIWDTGLLAPTGVTANTYGSMHFRKGSLPILIGITDASFHNGRRAMSPATLHDPYSFNGTPPFPSPTIDDLATQMNALGARFLGLSASDGVRNGGDPYEDMAYLADHVASTVSPSAFGGLKCATGLSGTFVNPDGPGTAADPGGTCRLVFDVAKDGSGLSASVIAGVVALLKSIRLDVRVLAEPDPGPIDAVDTFIQSISVNASGGTDAAEPGFPCIPLSALAQLADIWSGPKGLTKVQDAVNESALGITPTQKICFNVVPIPNTTIPQTAGAQVFTAYLKVKAKNGAAAGELSLGTPRQIAFIVPPAPQ